MPRVRRRSRSKFRRVRQSLGVSGTVNHERHWRLMLSFDEFNGSQHSVDAVAEALGPYSRRTCTGHIPMCRGSSHASLEAIAVTETVPRLRQVNRLRSLRAACPRRAERPATVACCRGRSRCRYRRGT